MRFGAAYYRGTDCCLLVLDITNEDSFISLETWKNEFLEGAGIDDIENYPIAILVNKIDEIPHLHKVDINKVREWGEEIGHVPVYETSAKTGENVEQSFIDIVSKALKTSIHVSQTQNTGSIQLDTTNNQNNGCC